MLHHITLQKIALSLASLIASGFLLIIGKGFLMPIVLAVLFAFLLYPLTDWLERHKIPRILANFLALLLTICIAVGATIGLSFLTKSFIEDVPTMRSNIEQNIEDSHEWIEKTFSIDEAEQRTWVQKNLRLDKIISEANARSIFTGTTTTFLTVTLMFIYTFFFLYYRDKFQKFLFKLIPGKRHDRFKKVMHDLTHITPHYLLGLVIVVAILAILNSIGFMIIGVANPVFFGVLAAVLNIIPYIGTVIGFGLVFLFTLATQDVSTALWIIPVFFAIQFIENNILTPNITAGQVDLNPLVAIVGVTLAGALWGVVGMLIVIPLLGMCKIICANIPSLESVAYLLGSSGTEKYALSLDNIKKKFQQWFS